MAECCDTPDNRVVVKAVTIKEQTMVRERCEVCARHHYIIRPAPIALGVSGSELG